MKDERDDRLDRLFATVRAMKPDTAAAEEYFETRLMARLEEAGSSRALWSTWVWRLVPWFATIVIVVGIGSTLIDFDRSGDIFAAFTNGYEESLMTNLLAGG